MDQNIRTAGNKVTVAILAFCFFPCFILGVGILTSYPDEIWWAGLLLILCAVLIGVSAVSMYRAMKNERAMADKQMELVSRAKASSEILQADAHILASWVYKLSEWNEFMKWETQKRRRDTILEAVLLTIACVILIRFAKNEDWTVALTLSIAFGIFYGLMKYFLMMQSIKLNRQKQPEVIITTEAIVVNGRMNRFYGNNLWLGKVEVKEVEAFNILEVTYCWGTRRGKSFDEIRVPIPKGSLKEAIKVQDKLMTAYLT